MSIFTSAKLGGQIGRLAADAAEILFCPTKSGKKWLMYLSNSPCPVLVKPSTMKVILKVHPNARQSDSPPGD